MWLRISCLFSVVLIVSAGNDSGPIGTLTLLGARSCPDVKGIKIEMKKDGQNRRALGGEIELKQDFNDKNKYKFRVHKWTGSEYKKDVIVREGEACKDLKVFVDKLKKRAYDEAKIKGDCNIAAGKYKINTVYGHEKEVDIKTVQYGKFQLEISVYDEKKKNVLGCILIDIESKR